MPKGPAGKTFPTIGYASWSMFATSENKDLAWKLIAALDGPEGNIAWNKKTGALPIYKSAEKDPFYAEPKFKGWFAELSDPQVQPLVMPTYLEEFAFFADSIAVKTTQQALLGQLTPEQLAGQWADYLTKAQQKFLAKKK
jgi:multiple sugar transport system substrate-binding protein